MVGHKMGADGCRMNFLGHPDNAQNRNDVLFEDADSFFSNSPQKDSRCFNQDVVVAYQNFFFPDNPYPKWKKSTQTQPILNKKNMKLFYTEETNWRMDRIDNLICSLGSREGKTRTREGP